MRWSCFLWIQSSILLQSSLGNTDKSLCSNGYRIAIIGGGISGTFTAKYLAEYDVTGRAKRGLTNDCCRLNEIHVYDAATSSTNEHWQGSRVASTTLGDEQTVVELGASLMYAGNQLVAHMIEGEENSTLTAISEGTLLGIYDGQGQWKIPGQSLSFWNRYPQFLKRLVQPLGFLWKYKLDYFRVHHALQQIIHAIDILYQLLNDTQREVTYFSNPIEMWEAIGLKRWQQGITIQEFLDGLGLLYFLEESNDLAWWKPWVTWSRHSTLRSELVTIISMITDEQHLNLMNGLMAYVIDARNFYFVQGGNDKLMTSAINQAKLLYESSSCESMPSSPRIQQYQERITTVVSNDESMELWSKDESLGKFDVVILAAPLQMCQIQFLILNPMNLDSAILHQMPLSGFSVNDDPSDYSLESLNSSEMQAMSNEYGERSFASALPPSATLPYIPVVTTIISNGILNITHFGWPNDKQWPELIMFSKQARLMEGITALTVLSAEKGLFKILSSEIMSDETGNKIFGLDHIVEYQKVWDGKFGGATPSTIRDGKRHQSLPYLLYDGAKHWRKSYGPALYYVNAIEDSVAAMEISAIGAKSTAKLVAQRLGLIQPQKISSYTEEL